MISQRLKAIASLISKDDIVLDVGCDHGYLDIYLKENDLCQEVYASDISEGALNSAKDNFKKHNLKIKTYLSDGFDNVDVNYNTAVISGMGSETIKHILASEKTPDKLVLSSHKDLYSLRKYLNENNWILEKEVIVYENKHYYSIMLYKKGNQVLSKIELLYGISNNKDYYQYLYNKNSQLIKIVPFIKKINLLYNNHLLKKLIGKK